MFKNETKGFNELTSNFKQDNPAINIYELV